MTDYSSGKPDGDTYWAAEVDGEKLVGGLIARIRRYRETLKVTGRANRMRRNWMAWQGWGPRMDADASRVLPAGESGEMVQLNVNQFAAMVNQAVVLTTSNKVAVKAVPTNADFESLAQAQLAESLNDYYEREVSVDEREYDAALGMVLMSESWVVLDWDRNAGQPYMPSEGGGQPVRSGDVRVMTLTPFDVAYDPDVQDIDAPTWVAFRRRVNKWDLAAQYPAKRDKLLAAKKADGTYDVSEQSYEGLELRRRRNSDAESDCVYVWELRHTPTPALPNGRRVVFVDAECVLQDSVQKDEAGVVSDYGYPYGSQLFAFSGAPERVPGTPDGHTSFFDLLSLQEGVDLSASIMMSAVNAGGLQNLYVPRGANITADKLTGALNVIEYDGPLVPKAESNVAINPAVSEWAEMCVTWMRQRVALNDVVMGEPSKGMPAQAMALLRAQAVEFHSRLQAAYERLVQRVRTGILRLLQKYAQTERVALVAGTGNAWALKHFKAGDIAKVDRFIVEPVNPLMKSLAGRVGFIQPLLETGRITLEEFFGVAQTGRYEPMMKFGQDNRARIQREKEMLMRGVGLPPVQMQMGPMGPQPVMDAAGMPVFADDGKEHIRPLITDTHWLDIPEYLGVLAMPEVRDNPMVVRAVTETVDFKMKLWRSMDPAIIMLLKGQLPPPPVMPGTMPPTPGGPPSGTPPPAQGEPSTSLPPGAPDVTMPKPPRNPITGEQDLGAPPQPGV